MNILLFIYQANYKFTLHLHYSRVWINTYELLYLHFNAARFDTFLFNIIFIAAIELRVAVDFEQKKTTSYPTVLGNQILLIEKRATRKKR